MSEKEYIVILNKDVDYDQFNTEMIAETGEGAIPGRTVGVANARPGSYRMTHYNLTDEEVTALKLDDRVYDIHIPPEDNPDLVIEHKATQTGNFRKTSSITASELPWTIGRSINNADPWGSGVTNYNGTYNYTLTGKGVDVVIQDGGVDFDDVEFTDENGVSRCVELDWYTASGTAGTMPTNHYLDYDGHGSHVAGTACGRTVGWARGSAIYSQKIAGLTGSEGGGISPTVAFDQIKLWHRAKPVDPATGYKRPTIVNMSWGYLLYYNTVTSLTFRGTTHTDTNTIQEPNNNYRYQNYGLVPISGAAAGQNYKMNNRVSSVDVDLQELIDEGVHVCVAAGNKYHKVDRSGGTDWNNLVVTNSGSEYYHRGSSPAGPDAILVGNMDITYQGGLEHKAESSECGPGVDIYAPGTNIFSVSSTDNAANTNDIQASGPSRVQNALDANSYLMKISGTSMASPSVCGMLACVLELYPWMTPAELKQWMIDKSTPGLLYEGATDDFDDQDSIQGGNNRIAYMPFQRSKPVVMTNVTFKKS